MPFVIFLFFLALAIVEVLVFFELASHIGLLWAFVLIIAAAVGGMALLRAQGFAVMRDAEASIARGEVPLDAVLQGLLLLAAGMFFIIPGFISDILALLLLLPGLRTRTGRIFAKAAASRNKGRPHPHSERASSQGSAPFGNSPSRSGTGPVIDAEYEDRTPRSD